MVKITKQNKEVGFPCPFPFLKTSWRPTGFLGADPVHPGRFYGMVGERESHASDPTAGDYDAKLMRVMVHPCTPRAVDLDGGFPKPMIQEGVDIKGQ